ncbi:phage tail length tape measure family protein [Rhodobacter sp. NTK016B]|uniref:phage tail length tape measure family protein n=1 Tax=Rhodobacter sp. NTK016B TaxID=2759676 RepID=UPI001A8E4BF6|nr:phage tail length tape measure family protein [Rhodobacter sp. NTK016B]MBN8294738.1 phage tail length tape measure family protein [Rhodobacter sp. NTK016B]
MAAGDLTASIILRFLAEQARREMVGAGNDLKGLGDAAQAAGAKATGAASALTVAAAATQSALAPTEALGTAYAATLGHSINLTAQMGRNATAIAGAQNAVTGLTRDINDQVQAMQAEQAALGQWRSELDQIRARFNPIFGVTRQYEQELREIAEAERLGAITATEAANARDRAAMALQPVAQGIRSVGDTSRLAAAHTANLSFQLNDIVMMTAVGQSPWMLMMQQGPQVVQVMGQMRTAGLSLGTALRSSLLGLLNPAGLATIALIGIGAAGVQALTGLRGETKSFDDSLGELNDTLGRMRTNLDLVRNLRLGETFGGLSADVRALAQGMLELDRASQLEQLQSAVDTFGDDQVAEGWGQWIGRLMAQSRSPLVAAQESTLRNANLADNYAELGAANSYDDFSARVEALNQTARAGDIEGVVEQLVQLQQAMSGGGAFSEMSTELRTILSQLQQAGISIARVEALWNGSASDEARARAVDDITRGYTEQTELARAAATYGQNSAELEAVRARHQREALRLRLQEIGAAEGSAEALRAQADLEAMLAAEAERSARQRQRDQNAVFDDLRRQAELSQAILAYGEDSAQAEAVRARHANEVLQARLTEMGMAPALIAQALELNRAEQARALLVRETSAARELGRSQAERIERLRLEQSLLGQSEATRRRIIALWEVERDLQRDHINASSARAAELRSAAVLEANLAIEVERQTAAWQSVQSSAETAIESIVDKLTSGDIEGALEALADQILGTFNELAIVNPLQNALLGTNHATLQDAGGLRGIFERLTGRNIAGAQPGLQPVATSTMSVTASSVSINGAPLGLLSATPAGALSANTGQSPEATALLQGVAQMGAARPDGITGLSAALADPLAAMIAEAQTLFGQDAVSIYSGYRSNEVQARLWEDALQRYGSPEAARRWVAPPGNSRHNYGLAADLRYGSPEVQSWMHQNAGRFGLDYRMDHEPWHIEPANAGAIINGQQQATAALTRFTAATTDAGTDLGTLGQGFDVFGNALASGLQGLASGGTQGGITGLLQSLAFGIAGALGIPGFRSGGWTGPGAASDVAGVVHAGEYVFDAAATQRIGVDALEAIRTGAMPGFEAGGYVPGPPPRISDFGSSDAAPSVVQLQPVLVNNTGRPMQLETEESTDARGQRQMKYVLSDMVGEGLATPGGRGARTLEQGFGVRRNSRRRQL